MEAVLNALVALVKASKRLSFVRYLPLQLRFWLLQRWLLLQEHSIVIFNIALHRSAEYNSQNCSP
jgi:hypothetical protein